MQKVDERGKFFTERVHTQSVQVLVRTLQGEVRGHFHILPGQRVKDMLNSADQFIALTEATMRRHDRDARHRPEVERLVHAALTTPLGAGLPGLAGMA